MRSRRVQVERGYGLEGFHKGNQIDGWVGNFFTCGEQGLMSTALKPNFFDERPNCLNPAHKRR
jgi:hypothetical protein